MWLDGWDVDAMAPNRGGELHWGPILFLSYF